MIRRSQLLGPGSRVAGRVVAASVRIRDGLLHDNKVIPVVFAILALLVFAWILAGALIGGEPDGENKGQVANQASQAQSSQDPDNGGPESTAPGVENRDDDSYSAFEKKDPFGDIGVEKTEENGSNNGGGGGNSDRSSSGDNASGAGGSTDRSSPGASNPGESGSNGGGDRSGGGGSAGRSGGEDSGQGRSGQGAGQGSGVGQNGNVSQGGRGNLFDSGGDLIVP